MASTSSQPITNHSKYGEGILREIDNVHFTRIRNFFTKQLDYYVKIRGFCSRYQQKYPWFYELPWSEYNFCHIMTNISFMSRRKLVLYYEDIIAHTTYNNCHASIYVTDLKTLPN